MGSYTPSTTVPGVLAPGDHLDRYELLCILAQGGMGTVWLARMSGKLGFERLVAVKTILPNYSNDRQFSDMFLDEARIAAQIDHENVARILEIGEDRGCLYYAMELIEGESLRKLYRDVRAAADPSSRRFPIGVALRIIADASAGLHATHELRREDGESLEVVHRDVSPQNLLLTSRGTTKLIDFGVAKANARRSEDTAAGTLKGKLEYMAPEQARGITLDRRADVYALGAVLFELIAGRPVRDTDEGKQLAVLHDLMTGVPYEPLPLGVPDVVRHVVDRALARDAKDRFPTADALRLAIEHAIVVTGVVATSEEVASTLARFSRARTQKRRDVIEHAIRAAAEGRLNATTLVAPIGSVESMPAVPAAAASASHPGGYPSSSPVPSGIPAFDASVSTSRTGPSLQSVGAAMTASVSPPPQKSSAMRVLATIVMFAAVAVLGVTLGVVLTRRSERLRARATVAAAPPPPAVVVTAAPGSDPAPVTPSAAPETPPTSVAVAASASAAPRDTKDGGKRRRPRGKRSEGDEYGF